MGHNYGTNYAGYPWLGILMMTIFCMSFGCFVSWLTLKEGSIWPAVIAHAVLNGLAGISLFLLASPSTPILGPLPVNLIGGLPFLVVAILLLLIPGALNEAEDKTTLEARTYCQQLLKGMIPHKAEPRLRLAIYRFDLVGS